MKEYISLAQVREDIGKGAITCVKLTENYIQKIKASNYQIDTYKKKIFIYGISITIEEKKEVIKEAKEILDVENVIASIVLVDDLRIQKN